MTYHKPVLLNESINGLNIKPDGVYVDVTFGGGGHSKEILKYLKSGKLYAFDQDSDAIRNNFVDSRFKLIKANFRYLKNFLKIEGVTQIDGLLADLGVSSHQFDIPDRGFSLRFDSELDMRMNINSTVNAFSVINNYSEEELANVFYNYGEIYQSRKVASKIIKRRIKEPITTTTDLIEIIKDLFPFKKRQQFLARIFQAIRIEVNDEINALKEMLTAATQLLKPEARLVVISYHSLEDRLVKNLIKKGNFNGIEEKDFFGNKFKLFNQIKRGVIVPDKDECSLNSRASSAKMRIAEKVLDEKK